MTESWSTLAASLVALFGAAIMVGCSVADGHLFGDFSLGHDGLHGDHDVDRSSASTTRHRCYLLRVCWALLGPLLVWLFAAPLDVSTIDLLKLFLFGTTQLGLGLVFLIVGSHTRSWKFRLCGDFLDWRNCILPANRSSSRGSRAWGRRSRSRDWTGLRRNCANLR